MTPTSHIWFFRRQEGFSRCLSCDERKTAAAAHAPCPVRVARLGAPPPKVRTDG